MNKLVLLTFVAACIVAAVARPSSVDKYDDEVVEFQTALRARRSPQFGGNYGGNGGGFGSNGGGNSGNGGSYGSNGGSSGNGGRNYKTNFMAPFGFGASFSAQ